jgi:carboxyl-terminal processing protease
MSRVYIIVAVLLAAVMLTVGGFAAGIIFERYGPADLPVPTRSTDLVKIVGDTARILDREALEPASEESMTAGAIQGMLDSLDDPYAVYLNERHFDYFNEQTDGEFFGIGITVTVREGSAVVVAPIEGTPAWDEGLLAEDEIVTIDGYTEDPWSLEQVVSRIRGPEGTDVELGIRRNGGEELLEFTITRARIDIPNVTSELIGDDVGYIRLMTFNSRSDDSVREVLAGLEAQGAEGYILDLRDNPGGLLESAVDVTSLFVADGLVVRVEGRDGVEDEHRVTGDVATDLPLVVLINENSASASEIVAGALQDYERAELVGQESFGKGSVQTVEALANGAAVKFTTAHYVTPKGRSIHKKGLDPDHVVEMSPKDQAVRDDDVQLEEAIDVIRDLIEG